MSSSNDFNDSKNADPPFFDELNIDSNVKDKLSLLLSRILKGNRDVYVTPFAKEYGETNILREFDEMFDAKGGKLNEVLYNLEMSNKAKYGPRSIAAPWKDRKQSLLDSFKAGKHRNLEVKTIKLDAGRLRPISLSKALDLLKNDTSSGLPYFTRKGVVKQRVFDKFDELLSRRDPCLLFTRTQESEKTRNVWGYPMADTLNEMMFYKPLLDYQRKRGYRCALNSPDEVGRRITDLVIQCANDEKELLSIDFSAFDNSLKVEVQEAAFKYIKSLFQSTYHNSIEYIFRRFNEIGIVTPDGVKTGSHGVPSGSTFTNEVDSICQYLIAISLPTIEEDRIQVQGDDGVYLLPKGYSDILIQQFESFGLIVNRDKSYLSNNYAIYLQCLYHEDYIKNGFIGGIYPVYRALNRLVYQERWSNFEDYGIKGKDYYSIRAICILENCKYHPLFEELVKFVLARDKYSLTLSDEGLMNYVQMIRKTKGAGEILNHQYGDDVSGIKSFETYKLINGLG